MRDPEFNRRALRSLHVRFFRFFPRRRGKAINLFDAIAWHNPGLRNGVFVRDRRNVRRLVQVRLVGQAAKPEKSAEQQNRHHQIHSRPRNRNQRSLPPLLAHHLVRRTRRPFFAGVDLHQILSRHPHISTERQRANSVIRRAAFPTKQARPKSNRKHIHAYAKQTRHNEMAPLVDQNHHAQHQHNSKHRIHRTLAPPFSLTTRLSRSPSTPRPLP